MATPKGPDPAERDRIVWGWGNRESGNSYARQHDDLPGNKSSASGAYQFTDRTWKALAGKETAEKYPRAYLAPPQLQDQAARKMATQLYREAKGDWAKAVTGIWGRQGLKLPETEHDWQYNPRTKDFDGEKRWQQKIEAAKIRAEQKHAQAEAKRQDNVDKAQSKFSERYAAWDDKYGERYRSGDKKVPGPPKAPLIPKPIPPVEKFYKEPLRGEGDHDLRSQSQDVLDRAARAPGDPLNHDQVPDSDAEKAPVQGVPSAASSRPGTRPDASTTAPRDSAAQGGSPPAPSTVEPERQNGAGTSTPDVSAAGKRPESVGTQAGAAPTAGGAPPAASPPAAPSGSTPPEKPAGPPTTGLPAVDGKSSGTQPAGRPPEIEAAPSTPPSGGRRPPPGEAATPTAPRSSATDLSEQHAGVGSAPAGPPTRALPSTAATPRTLGAGPPTPGRGLTTPALPVEPTRSIAGDPERAATGSHPNEQRGPSSADDGGSRSPKAGVPGGTGRPPGSPPTGSAPKNEQPPQPPPQPVSPKTSPVVPASPH